MTEPVLSLTLCAMDRIELSESDEDLTDSTNSMLSQRGDISLTNPGQIQIESQKLGDTLFRDKEVPQLMKYRKVFSDMLYIMKEMSPSTMKEPSRSTRKITSAPVYFCFEDCSHCSISCSLSQVLYLTYKE